MYNTLMQPGDMITPGGQPPEQQDAPAPQTAPERQEFAEQPSPAPQNQQPQPVALEPQAPEPAQEPPQQPASGWNFTAEESESFNDGDFTPQPADVTWTASEYIAHDKNFGWYVLVVMSSAVLAAMVYLITQDIISPIVIVTIGVAFAAFGARKPQVLEYTINSSGVHIGQRHYPYGMFRTFSIVEEDATRSILLMPIQRFNLPISIYYDPADEEKIVEALGSRLPNEDRRPSPIDNLMRKIRF